LNAEEQVDRALRARWQLGGAAALFIIAPKLTARRRLRYLQRKMRARVLAIIALIAISLARSTSSFAQADPAAEPSVLAVAKVLPAVVNINTERVVRRTVRDPIE